MKTRMQNRKRVLAVTVIILALTSQAGRSLAFCVKDCNQSRSFAPSADLAGRQNLEYRQQSHNFGDNSTSVLGDVNVRVGHEHMEIKGMENTSNTMVDASINSTVIVGNMK